MLPRISSEHAAEDIRPCCPGHLLATLPRTSGHAAQDIVCARCRGHQAMLPRTSSGHVAQDIWPCCPGYRLATLPRKSRHVAEVTRLEGAQREAAAGREADAGGAMLEQLSDDDEVDEPVAMLLELSDDDGVPDAPIVGAMDVDAPRSLSWKGQQRRDGSGRYVRETAENPSTHPLVGFRLSPTEPRRYVRYGTRDI